MADDSDSPSLDEPSGTTIKDGLLLVSPIGHWTTTQEPLIIMGAYGILFILLVIAAIVLVCTLFMMLLTYLGCSKACQRCRYLNRELL